MNVVFIIPTGIGCTIGGHAGDATPAARMIAESCDNIILNPNVVNASDINEMPHNALYVEGSMIDRFLLGEVCLQKVRGNHILVAVNKPIKPDTMNAINAAKAIMGISVEVLELDTPLIMHGLVDSNGVATGNYSGVDELIKQVMDLKFDALAIASPIDVPEGAAMEYFRGKGPQVNPWGGIEAMVSRKIARALYKPVAHAPIEGEGTKEDLELMNLLYNEVVEPSHAAEVVSNCYIHCLFRGLHKAPRFGKEGIRRETVGAMITPYGCIGPPHRACLEAGIPVIAVNENETSCSDFDKRFIYVENYLEAAGVVNCIKAGMDPYSVRV